MNALVEDCGGGDKLGACWWVVHLRTPSDADVVGERAVGEDDVVAAGAIVTDRGPPARARYYRHAERCVF